MKKVLVFITGRGCASFPAPRRRARARRQRGRPARAVGTRDERFPPFPLFFLESRPKAPTSLFFSHTKGTSLFQPPPLPPSLPPSEKKIKNAEVDALSGRSRARAFLSRAFPRGRFRVERALHELDERLLDRVLDRVLAAAAGHRVLEDVLRRAAAPSAAWAALSISASARSSTTVFFSIIISEQHHCKATTTTPKTFPEEVRFRDCITARRKSAQRGTGQGLGA